MASSESRKRTFSQAFENNNDALDPVTQLLTSMPTIRHAVEYIRPALGGMVLTPNPTAPGRTPSLKLRKIDLAIGNPNAPFDITFSFVPSGTFTTTTTASTTTSLFKVGGGADDDTSDDDDDDGMDVEPMQPARVRSRRMRQQAPKAAPKARPLSPPPRKQTEEKEEKKTGDEKKEENDDAGREGADDNDDDDDANKEGSAGNPSTIDSDDDNKGGVKVTTQTPIVKEIVATIEGLPIRGNKKETTYIDLHQDNYHTLAKPETDLDSDVIYFGLQWLIHRSTKRPDLFNCVDSLSFARFANGYFTAIKRKKGMDEVNETARSLGLKSSSTTVPRFNLVPVTLIHRDKLNQTMTEASVPVGLHWVLFLHCEPMVPSTQPHMVYIFNSLPSCEALLVNDYTQVLHQAILRTYGSGPKSTSDVEVEFVEVVVPTQKDTYNCGVHLLSNARAVMRSLAQAIPKGGEESAEEKKVVDAKEIFAKRKAAIAKARFTNDATKRDWWTNALIEDSDNELVANAM